MARPKLNLRALEMFESAARTRSFARTAEEMNCAVSSVSHHLKRLESQLGVALFDHARRPVSLTPAGLAFQRRIADGLHAIRLGVSETSFTRMDEFLDLRIAIVEEFENVVATELLVALSERLPRARFKLTIQPSYDALARLRARQIELAIVTEPTDLSDGFLSSPLLRDPFVLAAPKDHPETPEQLMRGDSDLPFLRYNPEHVIGRQVAAHLRRRSIALDNRFEIDSNQSILGVVAKGKGWSLTTVIGYMRAARFHDQVRLHPPPGPAFARYISIFTLPDFSAQMTRLVSDHVRALVEADIVRPAIDQYDWLAERLSLSTD